MLETCEKSQKGRLPAPRRAKQRENLTSLDFKIHPIDRRHGAEPLVHVGQSDGDGGGVRRHVLKGR